jgi:hypothetical protein
MVIKRMRSLATNLSKSPDADKKYYDTLDRDAFEKAGMRVVSWL